MPETEHRPGPETGPEYREALGCFGTGVTVVTTTTPNGPLAMTANSFASVSLEPPLVLWCPARASLRHDAFVNAKTYMIHVMAEDQQPTATHFARSGEDFDAVAWAMGETGLPVLQGALARFECRRHSVHAAGDHSMMLGEVIRFWHRPGQGLMFKRGRYGGFADLT